MVAIQNRAADYLGTQAGYEEVAELGIFSKQAAGSISILIPSEDGTMEIVIQQ